MTQIEKLLTRLLSNPKDFTFDELEKLLGKLGFEEKKTGKTSGSRKAFIHTSTKLIIRLHKPHPSNILKTYAIREVIEVLKKGGLI